MQRHVANVLLFFVDTAQPFVRMKAAVGNGEADASVSPAGFDRPPFTAKTGAVGGYAQVILCFGALTVFAPTVLPEMQS